MLHLHSRRIDTYRGNVDVFEKTKEERLLLQQREYDAQMKERAHVQVRATKFCSRFVGIHR
jgi:ATP-binding cassette subfamily F protein 3